MKDLVKARKTMLEYKLNIILMIFGSVAIELRKTNGVHNPSKMN